MKYQPPGCVWVKQDIYPKTWSGNLFYGKDSSMGILAVTLINTVQKDQFLNIQIFFWGIPTKNFHKVGK